MNLPPEIWEKILENLADWDAVNCSHVCQTWHNLQCRRIKDYCLRTMTEFSLRELLDLTAPGTSSWQKSCTISSVVEERGAPPPETWPKILELHLQTRSLDFVATKSLRGTEFLESFGDLVVTDDVREKKTLLNFFTLPSLASAVTQPHGDSSLKPDAQPSHILLPDCPRPIPVPGKIYEMVSLYQHLGTRVFVASVLGSNQLQFFCVQRNSQALPEVTKLQGPAMANLCCAVTCHRSFISADNTGTLAVARTEESISLLRVAVDVTGGGTLELRVTQATDVQFSCTVSRFFLYQNTLKTVVKSGEVLVHRVREKQPLSSAPHDGHFPLNGTATCQQSDLKLEAVCLGQSEEYRDLAYPNPTFFCQHYLFVSSFVTHQLLYYWHMDRDIDYWMVGFLPPPAPAQISNDDSSGNLRRSSATLSECASGSTSPADPATTPSDETSDDYGNEPYRVRLQKVVLGRDGDEVLAVYYQRGLLFAATQRGTVLVYRLDASHLQKEPLQVQEGLRDPLLKLAMCTLPITKVTAVFSDRFIYVFALEKHLRCRLALVKLNWNRAASSPE